MVGKVIYYNPKKHFGIVEVKSYIEVGYRFDRYYLHASRIKFTTFDPPIAGLIARFDVWNKPKRQPSEYPCAVDAELFGSIEEMRNYDLVTNPTLAQVVAPEPNTAASASPLDVLAGVKP